MGTEMALGRGIPTVALFPAGAENFASIGAARERETSTPGYRPGLRRRGGQQGGPLSPVLPHHVSTLHRIHCTPLQWCTQTLSLHTPSHLCTAQHHSLSVPQPHPAQQDSHPLSLQLRASPLQYPHIPLCSAVHLSLGLGITSLRPDWVLLGVLEHTDTCPCAHSLPLACTSSSSAPPVQVLYNTAVLHSTAAVDKAKILRAGHH